MIDLSQNDGMVTVKTPDGREVAIDLWAAYWRVSKLYREHVNRDDVAGYHEAVVALAQELGLPKLSHWQAKCFADDVFEMTASLKKTREPTSTSSAAASPGSTTATPEASARATSSSGTS